MKRIIIGLVLVGGVLFVPVSSQAEQKTAPIAVHKAKAVAKAIAKPEPKVEIGTALVITRAVPVVQSTPVQAEPTPGADETPVSYRGVDGACITTGASTAADIGEVNDPSCVGDETLATVFWTRTETGECMGTGSYEAAAQGYVYDPTCES